MASWSGAAWPSPRELSADLLAGAKNRDYSFWIAWCFVLPPLVFILLLLPRYQGPRPRQPRLDESEERGF